ncbi:hypothetical protein lerEdw1_005064 [Lerista edwardsae]|nr:hypothetical protein lerEdw1_005064 [Lerista edwardsae]
MTVGTCHLNHPRSTFLGVGFPSTICSAETTGCLQKPPPWPPPAAGRSGEGTPHGLEKKSSIISYPKHADSPTSMSSLSSMGPESELGEVVVFMRKFLQGNSQDPSDKRKFLDCVDIINMNITKDRRERVTEQLYNPSLLREVLQFLLPDTSSPAAEGRELALARISNVISCITNHCVGKGMKDFKLGQIVGTLTLCLRDPSEDVCHWAADGLHRLYTLILTQKGMTTADDNREYRELLREWEEEKVFWLAWFSDVSNTSMIFKRCLRADDQTDFMLIAVKGMKDQSIYNTKAAVQMLKAMLRDPMPSLMKTPKAIQVTHHCLDHISDTEARHEVHRYIRLLGNSHPAEVVKALLNCSLQCDSTASAMWHALTSFSEPAQKMLSELQDILLEKPLNVEDMVNTAALRPLAATTALYEILKHLSPACKGVLKAMYPMLSIAVLCQISYTLNFTHQEIDIYWRICIQQHIPTPLVPFRSALRTFKSLLKRAGDGDQALIMNKRGGLRAPDQPQDSPEGRHTLCQVSRWWCKALIRSQGCTGMLSYLMDILDSKDESKHITAMTFLVELIRQQAFDDANEGRVIKQLRKKLTASKFELRSLSLDGMLHMATHPDKIAKLEAALPDILARLKEVNRDVNVKALHLLPYLLRSLQKEGAGSLAMDVATRVLPLFDDVS